ncbi:MAG: acyltransferase [Acidobacteriota bacterium]
MKFVREFQAWVDAVLRHLPGGVGVRSRRLVWGRRFHSVGPGLVIEEGVVIRGAENVTLGEGVALLRGSSLYAERATCRVGNRSAIGIGSMIDANENGEIAIGEDVMIAVGCVLRASNHEYRDPSLAINRQGHTGGRIIIGNDVWLGANCVVVAGVEIADHSIVGAGAVVTKNVEPWTIVAGVPARMIGRRSSS